MGTEKANGLLVRAECAATNRSDGKPSKSDEGSQPINPANLPAERCVLGALIEDDSLLPKVTATGLQTIDFLLSDHQRVFGAIERLKARNAPVDHISVAEELGNRAEDYAVVADLVHGVVPHQDHVLNHVSIVRRKARLRALLRIADWIMRTVTESADADLLVSQIRNMLDECLEAHVL